MKVKFYKGPWHGKVRDATVRYIGEPILVSVHNRDYQSDNDPWNNTIRKGLYECTMMSVNIGDVTYTAPAMHPDGSIFYIFKGYDR